MIALTLEGVKPGDRIAAARRGLTVGLYTVERVTKTLAVCERGISFRIDNGVQQGTGQMMHSTWGRLVSDDDIKALHADLARKKRLGMARLAIREISITDENLEAAEAFIAASQPKAKESDHAD